MRITKDEARILAIALDDFKYAPAQRAESKEESITIIDSFQRFQDKLSKFGDDKRRHGRTSRDNYNDVIKRFVSSH